MSFAVVSSLYPHTDQPHSRKSIMTATYTFDVFSSLDGSRRQLGRLLG